MNLKIIILTQRNCHKKTYYVIPFIHISKVAKLTYGDRKQLPVAKLKDSKRCEERFHGD